MTLRFLEHDFTVCKLKSADGLKPDGEFSFIGRTDEEISLVCLTENTPADTLEREDGWIAFRIEGILDFSLIGILSGIAAILAENGIGIFAVSTYNTDYIFIKKEYREKAVTALSATYSINGK